MTDVAQPEIDPFEFLEDHQLGRITVPLKDERVLRLECAVIAVEPPRLEAEFLPDKLPIDLIPESGDCLLHFEVKGVVLSMVNTIETIAGDRRLLLSNRETATYPQKRRFFRAETELPVDLQYFSEGIAQVQAGEAVNLSGGGALVSFAEPLTVKHGVWMEIPLPEPYSTNIRCIAQVVRIDEEKDGRYIVGFNFDKVRPQDQDTLVAFCFELQRQHLRLKVRILGAVPSR